MENTSEMMSNAQDTKKEQTTKVTVPTVKELLKAGVQFGHESKRWNPKMAKYIYGEKNKIHIIDINQTEGKIKDAAEFLKDAASKGSVLFVGTKRQASNIVKDEAIRAGAYFVNVRWAGGLLTNFPVVKKSLIKLNSLEKSFEEGIEDRTKFEVSRMKKEWQRLERLYSGIKNLNQKPVAVVIIDTNFEKSAVRECRKVRIPIVGIVDTNSDPDFSDYLIPANDDAIGSINLLMKTLADAVLEGNKGNGVKHVLKDYSKTEIKITKLKEVKEIVETVEIPEENKQEEAPRMKETTPAPRSRSKVKGILERVKEEAEVKNVKNQEAKNTKKAKKPEVKKKAVVKNVRSQEAKETKKVKKEPKKKEVKKESKNVRSGEAKKKEAKKTTKVTKAK